MVLNPGDLALKRQNLASIQLQQLEHRDQLIQDKINAKRLDGSNQTVADVTSEEASAQRDPILEKESKINQQLSQQLIETTQKINDLGQENIKIKGWLIASPRPSAPTSRSACPRQPVALAHPLSGAPDAADPKITLNLDEQIADLRLFSSTSTSNAISSSSASST